ncbi:MAG: hypothetical protein LAO20_01875 [Acidobacteriia bacterium]|nr:hypothetical protein [Terriglobia bacterium]
MKRLARTVVLSAVAFLTAGLRLAPAQDTALLDRLKLRMEGSMIHFTEGGRKHDVSIEGQFDAARIDSVKVLSAQEGKGAVYLLLDVTGPSKLPRDKEKCGDTNESGLIWLKLDQDWQLMTGTGFPYSSCLYPITMVSAPKWDGSVLTARTNSQVATYDNANPGAGLKIAATSAAK